MDDRPEPDAFEKRLRFGCGFTFGGVFAFFSALRELGLATEIGHRFWFVVAGVAIVCGFLAMFLGDAFWGRPD